ncbi:MAG: hypothetical protein WBF71_04555 [Microthrixaceae bacterium]
MEAGLTVRLRRRIVLDFDVDVEEIEHVLESVDSANQDRERMLAAVVLGAAGDVGVFRELAELSHVDWRDLLVAGGLADATWANTLNRELGPPSE